MWNSDASPADLPIGAATILKVSSSNSSNISVVTFSVLVANPREILYTVVNPARGLLNPNYGDTTIVL